MRCLLNLVGVVLSSSITQPRCSCSPAASCRRHGRAPHALAPWRAASRRGRQPGRRRRPSGMLCGQSDHPPDGMPASCCRPGPGPARHGPAHLQLLVHDVQHQLYQLAAHQAWVGARVVLLRTSMGGPCLPNVSGGGQAWAAAATRRSGGRGAPRTRSSGRGCCPGCRRGMAAHQVEVQVAGLVLPDDFIVMAAGVLLRACPRAKWAGGGGGAGRVRGGAAFGAREGPRPPPPKTAMHCP